LKSPAKLPPNFAGEGNYPRGGVHVAPEVLVETPRALQAGEKLKNSAYRNRRNIKAALGQDYRGRDDTVHAKGGKGERGYKKLRGEETGEGAIPGKTVRSLLKKPRGRKKKRI